MRLLRHAASLTCITMVSLTAGCVTAYTPLLAGPTATLNVTVANSTGLGRLDIFPPGAGEKLILKNLDNPIGANTQTIVAADQSARLIYLEVTGYGNCTLRVEFTPEAGQTYNIYAGETKLPATSGLLGRLAQSSLPNGGEECVMVANQALSNGNLKPIALTRWSVF